MDGVTMSDKRTQDRYQETRRLQNAGIDVDTSDVLRFNSGSETYNHFRLKACVAFLGQLNGFFVEGEAITDSGEIDVLLYHPERRNIAVEIETSPTEEVKQDKLRRYVRMQEGVDEMFLLNATDAPKDSMDTLQWVSEQTGLKP
jgi:hypothetical protein